MKGVDKDYLVAVAILLIATGGPFFGWIFGDAKRSSSFEAEAVERGHAEWYAKDGTRKWRWKDCCSEEKKFDAEEVTEE